MDTNEDIHAAVYLTCPPPLCRRRPASPLGFWPWQQLRPAKLSEPISELRGQPSIQQLLRKYVGESLYVTMHFYFLMLQNISTPTTRLFCLHRVQNCPFCWSFFLKVFLLLEQQRMFLFHHSLWVIQWFLNALKQSGLKLADMLGYEWLDWKRNTVRYIRIDLPWPLGVYVLLINVT